MAQVGRYKKVPVFYRLQSIYYHYEFKNVDSKATQDLSAYFVFWKKHLE